ncbi:unnamed protein product [Rotaria socialis]|uniref:Uncharacterized protein n=1 Tax=Rotaria socialis TaxID=392032 RepID=A0A818MXC3_9BILA|nr:unnamed protein product [Rotaria socialis]CAF3510253.1 unnamed protein product [Rotaria socialis]CAF3596801.1 unnamed protein product [Rotaria socialis]CAF4163137.1 unnamed protein product [Rotaria socialis]CAF4165744.1 unnamed protein product [Rotaria socialis]
MSSTTTGNDDEYFSAESSAWMIDDNHHSISTIAITLKSFQSILTVSPKHILVNEDSNKRKRLILMDNNLKRYSTTSSITKDIIDAVWHSVEQKFLLLTETKVFTFDPITKLIESLSDMKSPDRKSFKCFTTFNNQPSLYIAYNEWGSQFIDEWQRRKDNNRWILIKKHSLNLTANEFIGTMLGIAQDESSNLAMTIYNDFTQQWRLELRSAETFMCLKKILLSGSNLTDDYRIVEMRNMALDIKWLIHSLNHRDIIGINSNYKKIPLSYKTPVNRMTQFNNNKLVILTNNELQVHCVF